MTNPATLSPPQAFPSPASVYRRVKVGGRRWDAQAINAAISVYEQEAGSVGGASGGRGLFYLNPADYAIVGLTTLFRLRLEIITNATAPTSTFTASLGTLVTPSGGAAELKFTEGTAVAGSSIAITAPAKETATHEASPDFTIVEGWYFLKLAIGTNNMVANSSTFTGIYLDVHNL